MHHIYKLAWVMRALLYKAFFASFKFPGYIGPPAFLMGTRRFFLGRRVRIFPGLRAECHGKGRLVIHDDVSIGQGFHVICSDELNIGEGCLLSANVFVTDTDHSYEDFSLPVFEQPNIVSKTVIGKRCFIGVGARIQAGTTLGDGCVVGANSVVRGEFPDHSVIVGAPARIVKRYNPTLDKWERC